MDSTRQSQSASVFTTSARPSYRRIRCSGSEANQANDPHARESTVFLKAAWLRSRYAVTNAASITGKPAFSARSLRVFLRSFVIAPSVATTSTKISRGCLGPTSARTISGRLLSARISSPIALANSSSRLTILFRLSLRKITADFRRNRGAKFSTTAFDMIELRPGAIRRVSPLGNLTRMCSPPATAPFRIIVMRASAPAVRFSVCHVAIAFSRLLPTRPGSKSAAKFFSSA